MKNDENVEVFYTIPVDRKIMIREGLIKDWEDEDEIKKYICEQHQVGDEYCDNEDDIQIVSIG